MYKKIIVKKKIFVVRLYRVSYYALFTMMTIIGKCVENTGTSRTTLIEKVKKWIEIERERWMSRGSRRWNEWSFHLVTTLPCVYVQEMSHYERINFTTMSYSLFQFLLISFFSFSFKSYLNGFCCRMSARFYFCFQMSVGCYYWQNKREKREKNAIIHLGKFRFSFLFIFLNGIPSVVCFVFARKGQEIKISLKESKCKWIQKKSISERLN